METILISLLVLAIALLLYYIGVGKKEKMITGENNDPLSGLPDILGRPKAGSSYRPTTSTDGMMREDTPKTIQKHESPDPQGHDQLPPDWSIEEEEMGLGIPTDLNEGFASGVTFDELALAGEMLSSHELSLSEQKAALGLASKIDGTQLLELLESKIGDASRKIAFLLEKVTDQKNDEYSAGGDTTQDGFNIGNFV